MFSPGESIPCFGFTRHIKEYVASDYDMSAHRAGIKLDLTDDTDVQPLLNSFDVIVCAHVLEHIPDYRCALENIYRILAPGGFLVLQVPLLEFSLHACDLG